MPFFPRGCLVSGPCLEPAAVSSRLSRPHRRWLSPGLGGTHILLGVLFCPGSLPVVTELGCAVQHAWGSLPKVGDKFNLLPGFISRDNCRGREGSSQGRRAGAIPASVTTTMEAQGEKLDIKQQFLSNPVQSSHSLSWSNSHTRATKRGLNSLVSCQVFRSLPDLKMKALVTRGQAAEAKGILASAAPHLKEGRKP